MFKVFISSNQTEFEKERQFIKKEFEADYFLKSFFKVFLFEDSPSFGLSPETTYFEEVRKSDVYIGLIGSDYGTIKDNGLSPTEEEYDEFHASNPDSFFYIQNVDKRDAESERFILKIQPDNKYSFFDTNQDLIDEIKKSLVKYIERGQKDIREEVKELKEGQKIIEKKLDGVVEQTAELLEFRTTVKTKLDELKEVEEVTKVNCYDIAKLKAVK